MNDEKQIQCPTCNTIYDKIFLIGKQGHADSCPMCGASLKEADLHPDWVTWRYYRGKKLGDYSLWDKLPLYPEELELIQEFKAPPNNSPEDLLEVKKILRTYIPDAFQYDFEPPKENKVRCPRCSSTNIQVVPRKSSFMLGLGTNQVDRVCVNCRKRF